MCGTNLLFILFLEHAYHIITVAFLIRFVHIFKRVGYPHNIMLEDVFQIFFTHTFFEHDLFIPRDEERTNSVLLTQARTRFHSS